MSSLLITPVSPAHSAESSLANSTPTRSQFSHTRLNFLQNSKTFHLLDEINKLRTHHPNISLRCADTALQPHLVLWCPGYLPDPASLLEALTGIIIDDDYFTFPIDIVFNRGQEAKFSVEVIISENHSEAEKLEAAKFKKYSDPESFKDQLPSLIVSACDYLYKLKCLCGVMCPDSIIRIVLTDPNGPELSIITLPWSETSYNDNEYIHKIASNPGTTILAITTAKDDFRLTREMCPGGAPILGIITEPDKLQYGEERSVIKLAKNEDNYLELGWHVLVNGKERNQNPEDRFLQGDLFFETHAWEDVPRSILGISSLRSKLGSLMFGHIKTVASDIYEKGVGALEDCETQLRNMGKRRSTITEQREFLSAVSEDFRHLCKAALCGVYSDVFFKDGVSIEGKLKRLRTVIQDLNTSFSKEMKAQGHLKQISEHQMEHGSGLQHERKKEPGFPEIVTRKEAAAWVRTFFLNSRGYEIPGTHNPLIVSELFKEQSKPWEALAQSHLDKMWKICRKFLQVLFQHIIQKTEIVSSIFSHLIDEQMRVRFFHASDELKRLIGERSLHTITLNDESLERKNAIRRKIIEKRCNLTIESSACFGWTNGPITLHPDKFSATLSSLLSEDLDDNACNEILEEMGAFYQVSFNVFIHNVATQVIERHLLDKLWEILSPSIVARISESLVSDIAAESIDDQYQRNRLEVRKKSLQTSLEACRDALWGNVIGNTYTTGGKLPSYFTSFMDPMDLDLIFKNLSTPDMILLKNPPKAESVGTEVFAAPKSIFASVGPTRATSQSQIVPGGAKVVVAGAKPAINPNEAPTANIFASKPITNPNRAASASSGYTFDTNSTTGASKLFAKKDGASRNTSAVPIAPTVDPAVPESSKLSESTIFTDKT
ncbi:hypothetical protein DFP73DRAFT_548209 [Morchella snyderi]|nr:hypothetical protein DFP73DRAFT_548209 [Morchella snyderi]